MNSMPCIKRMHMGSGFGNNLRQVGTVLEITETQEGIQLHFKASGNSENSMWVLSHKDIKYIDPFLK